MSVFLVKGQHITIVFLCPVPVIISPPPLKASSAAAPQWEPWKPARSWVCNVFTDRDQSRSRVVSLLQQQVLPSTAGHLTPHQAKWIHLYFAVCAKLCKTKYTLRLLADDVILMLFHLQWYNKQIMHTLGIRGLNDAWLSIHTVSGHFWRCLE